MSCDNHVQKPLKQFIKFNADSFIVKIENDSNKQFEIYSALTSLSLDTLNKCILSYEYFRTLDVYQDSNYKILNKIIECENTLSKFNRGKEILARSYLSNSYQYVLNNRQNEIIANCKKYNEFTTYKLDSQKSNYVLNTMGIAYQKLGDTKSAIQTLEKAMQLHKRYNYSTEQTLATIDNLLIAYASVHDTNKQIQLFDYALTLPGTTIDKKLKTLYKTSLLYNLNIISAQDASLIYKNIITEQLETKLVTEAKRSLGFLLLEQNKLLAAKECFLSIDTTSFYEQRNITKNYVQIGGICVRLNQLDSATNYYNLAINQLQSTKSINGHIFPTQPVLTDNTIYDALVGKANVILLNKNATIDQLNTATEFINIAEDISNALRKQLIFEVSKFSQSFDAKVIADKRLAVLYRKWQLTKQKKYHQDAFVTMELSKAVALQDKASQEIITTKINDTNYSKLQALHRQLNEIELLLQSSTNAIEIDSFKNMVNTINNDLSTYKSLADEVLPKTTPALTINKLCDYLNSQNALAIHYFLAEDALYISTLNPTTQQSNLTKLDLVIVDSIKKLSTAQADEYNKNWQLSHYVFQKIFKPFFTDQELNNHTIFVFGDGIINNIAFDALITNFDGQPHYLIEQTTIAQAYSVNSLILQQQRPASKSLKALAVTPFSNSPKLGLPALKNSFSEATVLKRILPTSHLTESEAKYSAFKSQMGNYGMLHLATHATANEPIQLAFYDTLLQMPSLFETPMYHNLAYINTCQSALGLSNVCEGNLSIGRVFYNNGVHNIIVTLWNMNDNSSALISNEFYKSFTKSKNSLQAIREAKLTYLKSQPMDKRAPYYWASLQHIGDGEMLHQINWRKYIGLGLILLSALWFYFFKIKKR